MKTNKIYTVNVNGCEPFRADRNTALANLWCCRVEGEKCSIYTPHDPGLAHAEKLKLSDFPRTGEVTIEEIGDADSSGVTLT